jgi:hypothetical protein
VLGAATLFLIGILRLDGFCSAVMRTESFSSKLLHVWDLGIEDEQTQLQRGIPAGSFLLQLLEPSSGVNFFLVSNSSEILFPGCVWL